MDMSLRINTNVEAFNAHRELVGTQTMMSQSMEKLSSGLRINRAADDAAGLAISEKMRAQIHGVERAHQNAMDGISMVQTGEGALNEVHSILQRVRELAVQYNNGTLSTADRAAITAEITQLSAEVGRIVNTTQFNGISLLSGGTSVTFQVGANAGDTIALANANLGGTYFDSVFATGFGATADINSMDQAINDIADVRATFGAAQNRLEHTINNLGTYQENLSAAESRIRDVDVAAEMVKFTKYQILSQSGTSMLAQANQLPQSVLKLLG
jgi:flagellin